MQRLRIYGKRAEFLLRDDVQQAKGSSTVGSAGPRGEDEQRPRAMSMPGGKPRTRMTREELQPRHAGAVGVVEAPPVGGGLGLGGADVKWGAADIAI